MTADELTEERPIGRRERKLQQTRSSLTRSALELFSERGFDAVTVVDIANRSDVDPSTFFRHFRSKESLLFTDMDNYVEMARPLLGERPADEPLIESLRAVNLHLSKTFDYDLENLRAELSESSTELRAQADRRTSGHRLTKRSEALSRGHYLGSVIRMVPPPASIDTSAG
jgi:AcrR family transcriptional regulator